MRVKKAFKTQSLDLTHGIALDEAAVYMCTFSPVFVELVEPAGRLAVTSPAAVPAAHPAPAAAAPQSAGPGRPASAGRSVLRSPRPL